MRTKGLELDSNSFSSPLPHQSTSVPDCMEAAQRCAKAGFRVLPLHSCTPHGCSCGNSRCGSPGKHPRLQNGVHGASASPGVVRGWWRNWPDANLAVATGKGLLVLDVDGPEGEKALAEIEAAHEPLPLTCEVQTARGRHIWLRVPTKRLIKNSVGGLGVGIDIRSDGGYALVPPSVHASGVIYRRITNGASKIAAAPAFLLTLLDPPAPPWGPPLPIRLDHRIDTYARRAIEGELEAIAHAPEPQGQAPGGRNNALHRAAVKLGSLAGAGLLDAGPVQALLLDAALARRMGEREARATIASGLRFGLAHPREISAKECAR